MKTMNETHELRDSKTEVFRKLKGYFKVKCFFKKNKEYIKHKNVRSNCDKCLFIKKKKKYILKESRMIVSYANKYSLFLILL